MTPTMHATPHGVENRDENSSLLHSGLFLAAAGGLVLVSLLLQSDKHKAKTGLFGQIFTPFILKGLHSTVAKTFGLNAAGR